MFVFGVYQVFHKSVSVFLTPVRQTCIFASLRVKSNHILSFLYPLVKEIQSVELLFIILLFVLYKLSVEKFTVVMFKLSYYYEIYYTVYNVKFYFIFIERNIS